MTRWIAFLRAINVGGHTVKMDALRRHFEALGFAQVTTFIASGNVIFEASTENARNLEAQIERHLRERLGYEVATFIRSTAELAEIATYRPFDQAELEAHGNTLYVAFLHAQPGEEAQRRLMALRNPVDDLHVHGREVYWLRRSGAGESALSGARLEKALGMPATVRNVNTVRRMAAREA